MPGLQIPASLSAMTKRNMLMFFRDRMSVLFSLLGALVVIGLYVFMLRASFISGLPEINSGIAARTTDLWLVAGLMAIVPVTTTGGALGILVSDRYSGRIRDFNSSPASSYSLTGGYMLSTLIVGSLLSILTLLLGMVYIVAIGEEMLSLMQMAKVLGLLLISILSSTSIMFFLTSLIWSEGGFTGLSLTVGIMAGFITGVYVPLGLLPTSVASFCSLLPMTHSASLFRDIMAGPSAEDMFLGSPQGSLETFRADLGYDLYLGDWMFPEWSSVVIIVASAAIFFLLAVAVMNRRSRV
ncbi:MAG TPA: ABC transporter permease [Candidatus Methanomethylophilaceae archaeon]|nr:ABC transporter permease [Candidatus Methanomethylophilaceae archaeon]